MESSRATLEAAGEHLAAVLEQVPGEVVFATCVTQDGYVSDSDCFVSQDRSKSELAPEAIFALALEGFHPAVLLTSRTNGSVLEPERSDIELTQRLIDFGRSVGVELYDHVIVAPDGRRSLRETTDMWS